jgi:diketogulonate reductase-like aldo/keto reductase
MDIANKHNKKPAQVIIRWHLDNGFAVIPKSVTPKRIEENFDVCDFGLTPKDIERINILNKNKRVVPFTEANHMPKYPFQDK